MYSKRILMRIYLTVEYEELLSLLSDVPVPSTIRLALESKLEILQCCIQGLNNVKMLSDQRPRVYLPSFLENERNTSQHFS